MGTLKLLHYVWHHNIVKLRVQGAWKRRETELCNWVGPHTLRLSMLLERVFKPPFHAQENNCESNCGCTNRDTWLIKATHLSTVSSPIWRTQNHGVKDRSLCFALSVNTWFTSQKQAWSIKKCSKHNSKDKLQPHTSCLALCGNGVLPTSIPKPNQWFPTIDWLIHITTMFPTSAYYQQSIHIIKSVTHRVFTLEVKLRET
jgi:hypothetical protein